MRRATALIACSFAIATAGMAVAQPSAGAGEHSDFNASCKPSPVKFQSPLQAGVAVADLNGKPLGKISQVKSDGEGAVSQVQYADDSGKTVTVDPLHVSYSGGPVALVWEAGGRDRCVTPPRQAKFPAALHAGVVLSDPHAQPIGTITTVQASADGVVSEVEYVDDKGAKHSINPADLSYSGGDVALLFEAASS